MLFAFTGNECLDRRAAALAADIDVVCARLLQREPDEFAAALNRRPIIELIAHRCLRIGRRLDTGGHCCMTDRGRVRLAAVHRNLVTTSRCSLRTGPR
jgi:hypothetical protein